MLDILEYLHGSELVARFQRKCGLFLAEAAHHGGGNAPTSTDSKVPRRLVHIDNSTGKQMSRSNGLAGNINKQQQDNNSNYKYQENGSVMGVSSLCKWTHLDLVRILHQLAFLVGLAACRGPKIVNTTERLI